MTNPKRRLLLIDNQQTEFNYISDQFLNGMDFEVYPAPEEYEDLINAVRFALNKRYPAARSEEAMQFIFDYIDRISPDAFIIDYQLVGPHDGRSGVYLGSKLQAKVKIPVFFLSRTPGSLKVVKEDKESVKPHTWIEKGYAGICVRDNDYFRRHIYEKVKEVLCDDEEKSYEEKLSMLRRHGLLEKHEDSIDLIKSDFSDEEKRDKAKRTIDALLEAVAGDSSDRKIRKIIQGYLT